MWYIKDSLWVYSINGYIFIGENIAQMPRVDLCFLVQKSTLRIWILRFRNYEITKLQNYESSKLRNYKFTKLRILVFWDFAIFGFWYITKKKKDHDWLQIVALNMSYVLLINAGNIVANTALYYLYFVRCMIIISS